MDKQEVIKALQKIYDALEKSKNIHEYYSILQTCTLCSIFGKDCNECIWSEYYEGGCNGLTVAEYLQKEDSDFEPTGLIWIRRGMFTEFKMKRMPEILTWIAELEKEGVTNG